MKIAFVAMPPSQNKPGARIGPPLPLGYMAALLEQQRHIVRIYDLALATEQPLDRTLAPLHAFRPHIVVIAAAHTTPTADVETALEGLPATFVHLRTDLREPVHGIAAAHALCRIDERSVVKDEKTVIFDALIALDDDLDTLPFPARHLLSLEQYPLLTHNGDVQTTVLTAQQLTEQTIIQRQPALIIAELQSIAREHGIRHVVFPQPSLTHDRDWLRSFLRHLIAADLGIRWEATVQFELLDPELLQLCQQAGCEALSFDFAAADVLLSRERRAQLLEAVAQAHAAGITVRAGIDLDSVYGAMPALIDISATFGLDEVQFNVCGTADTVAAQPVAGSPSLAEVAEMARTRYRSSRSRQFFVERFGPQLGPMLWRVGRTGLLGRTWRRYATGGEDAMAY